MKEGKSLSRPAQFLATLICYFPKTLLFPISLMFWRLTDLISNFSVTMNSLNSLNGSGILFIIEMYLKGSLQSGSQIVLEFYIFNKIWFTQTQENLKNLREIFTLRP